MSIPHQSLEDRLNAVKNGNSIPEPKNNDFTLNNKNNNKNQEINYKKFFINEGYKLFNVLTTSILYGYGINAIFSQEWNFLGCFGIGLLVNHLTTGIIRFLKNK